MKQIFTHFKLSIMFGAALLATFSSSHPLSPSAAITNVAEDSSTSSQSPDPAPSPNLEPSLDSDSELSSSPEQPTDQFVFASDLIIKAVNPGYTVDETQNVGEFIELQKTTDAPLSLANYSIRYTTASGKSTTLLNFSEGSSLVGEFLLMRLARSPHSEQSDATYMTTLAMGAGTVEILYNDLVVDSVCWASKSETCSAPFKSAHPTTLVRSLETGLFAHAPEYDPIFNSDQPSVILPSPDVPPPPEVPDSGDSDKVDDTDSEPESKPDSEFEPTSARCFGLEFSEILSYYAENKSEQFIELYNPTDRKIDLSFCSIRYKNKSYTLSGTVLPNSYFAIYPSTLAPTFALTKNPSSSNTIELLDAKKSVVDLLAYPHGQKKSTSYAKFYDAAGEEIWEITYAMTPGIENHYQEFRTCPSGKVINPDTGNCVKVSASAESSIAECPAGKYRNPLTGRCKSFESASSTEPKPCAAGYERNPETNRCRKIVAENDGAGYALVPSTSSSKSTFIALGAVALVVGLGIIYIILQFRHEIARAIRKIKQRLHHIR